ncbi:SCO2584 family spore wall biosynthesis protein [Streptomyces sp. 7N604]|uniref:SCO2584 family spore wall biosynthesis protein n=1 Tax=Streptomyces sp. 7N604 TaxID=3457415 RepID=UPI003FD5C9D5
MPDDVGGRPFPDGDEPDSHSHGAADEEFASVVFDEDFVRSARIHEPTAVERMLAAAQARAEAEARRSRAGSGPAEEEFYDDGFDPDDPDADFARHDGDAFEQDPDGEGYGPYGRYGGALGPYRSHARWHRPVAWVLAVVMGIGMVALAFAAVYRGTAGSRQEPAPPPATSGVDGPQVGQLTGQPGGVPRPEADSAAPTASAVPRAH